MQKNRYKEKSLKVKNENKKSEKLSYKKNYA